MTLDPITINHIRQGHHVIFENGNIRCATWYERFVRAFSRRDISQDREIASALIHHLASAKGSPNNKECLEAATHFIKNCKDTDDIFKQLENTIFAHKCHQILSIPISYLINEQGVTTSNLLTLIQDNHLHYVIRKANDKDKETALLCKGDEIFIRSKTGKCFLDTPELIQPILDVLPPNHTDRQDIENLKKALEENSPERQKEIGDLKKKLELSHYCYTSLKDIKVNGKGLLVSQGYLTQGLEDHDVSKWKKAKTTFIETAPSPSYKLRIITRLPEYALSKTWGNFIYKVLTNIFNYKAHGHSWIELVEPTFREGQQFAGQQKVTCVGYFLSQRFQNADPMAYMPIPKEQLVVEEIELDRTHFDKATNYLNTVQSLILDPKTVLEPQPENPYLQKEDIDKIQYLYKTTIKSTCLAFANAFKEAITGIEHDDRGSFHKWISPKKGFKVWDRLDKLFDKTYLLNKIIQPFRFFHRMELPFFRKKKPCDCEKP